MDGKKAIDPCTRFSKWIEEGEHLLHAVPELFEENERLKAAVETAERKCETLSRDVSKLLHENYSFWSEREQIGGVFAKFINDMGEKLRVLPEAQSF